MSIQEKYDKIRESGRNFNEEFMVTLWNEYNQKCDCDQCKPKKHLYWDKVPDTY